MCNGSNCDRKSQLSGILTERIHVIYSSPIHLRPIRRFYSAYLFSKSANSNFKSSFHSVEMILRVFFKNVSITTRVF